MSTFIEFRKKHITPAFKQLRKMGFYASTKNLQCCQTCTVSAMPDDQSYLCYHAQDVDGFEYRHDLYLGYHFQTEEDRLLALKTLDQHGLAIDWDGDVKQRIRIFAKN